MAGFKLCRRLFINSREIVILKLRNLCSDAIKHRVGNLYQPIASVPFVKNRKDGVKESSNTCEIPKLMMDYGLISSATPGTFNYLPLTMKSLSKLIRIIDEEMQNIGGQKLDMPCLISKKLLDKTGRWDDIGEELFKLKDREDRELCLGPTHEEVITELLSKNPNLSYKRLPILLYQIAKKYRDEIKPRFGLLRAREFLMKDMYSFHLSNEDAESTYIKVGEAYENILKRLELNFIKVEANSGKIGGNVSHEYHLPAKIGEDKIGKCSKCNYAANAEFHGESSQCKSCGSALEYSFAIEVAHTFLLGTKYSKPFNANVKDDSMKFQPMVMGCYGVGVSRILAAALEVLSIKDELRWPRAIVPYQICIIPPKAGSKEMEAELMAIHIYNELSKEIPNDVIYDDRINTTIGFRLLEAKLIGYPYVIVSGKTSLESVPKFELHDVYSSTMSLVTHRELFDFARKIHMQSL